MKSLNYYYKKAEKEKWAIGQFNFSTLEQMRAIIKAGHITKSPIILGTSENEAKFFGIEEAVNLKNIINKKYNIPIFLNLDHGKDLKFIKKAIDMGYSSVHYDGSSLSIKENIKNTKKIVSYAKKKGVLVEGEVGFIEGNSTDNKNEFSLKYDLTSPVEAENFVKETNVNLLAVAIGNVHGIYLKMPDLDFKLLSDIKEKTIAFLVLHGGSGIKEKYLKEAIKRGVVKVNINTETRKEWKDSLKKELLSNDIKPYNILFQVERKIEEKIKKKIILLGSNQKI